MGSVWCKSLLFGKKLTKAGRVQHASSCGMWVLWWAWLLWNFLIACQVCVDNVYVLSRCNIKKREQQRQRQQLVDIVLEATTCTRQSRQ